VSVSTWPTSFPPPAFVPTQHWSVDEFHQVRSEPWLESHRLILVEGVILETPSPYPPHDVSLRLTGASAAWGFWAGAAGSPVKGALVLNQATDPVPDVAVVRGSPRDYPQHARTAEVVVEIVESSLAYDTREKAGLYASTLGQSGLKTCPAFQAGETPAPR
jgi:Uma2 family endonuclease